MPPLIIRLRHKRHKRCFYLHQSGVRVFTAGWFDVLFVNFKPLRLLTSEGEGGRSRLYLPGEARIDRSEIGKGLISGAGVSRGCFWLRCSSGGGLWQSIRQGWRLTG